MLIEINGGLEGLRALVFRQMEFFCADQSDFLAVEMVLDTVLIEVDRCFEGIAQKYYILETGETRFNPHHSAQYGIFLYLLSRALSAKGDMRTADIIYGLGKVRNSCDLYHQIQLPACFFMEHPVGTVLGRAEYGNFLVFQQNCTVGGNKGVYPVLGEHVWLHANSSVIGETIIGNNVFIASNTHIMNARIPDNSIVFGSSPNLTIKERPPSYFFEKSLFKEHKL